MRDFIHRFSNPENKRIAWVYLDQWVNTVREIAVAKDAEGNILPKGKEHETRLRETAYDLLHEIVRLCDPTKEPRQLKDRGAIQQEELEIAAAPAQKELQTEEGITPEMPAKVQFAKSSLLSV